MEKSSRFNYLAASVFVSETYQSVLKQEYPFFQFLLLGH